MIHQRFNLFYIFIFFPESHNIFDDLMEFPIQRTTECCRAGSQTYVINLDYETLFMKFKDEMGMNILLAIVII